MAKKSDVKKVRLIRGGSYVIPGFRFVPGKWEIVPVEIATKLKASQQFSIKDVDDEDENEEKSEVDESEEEEAADDEAPKKKPRRKRR